MSKKTDSVSAPKPKTLCWGCKNSEGNCVWSAYLRPVPGWEAEKVPYKASTADRMYTYRVISCPLYESDRVPEKISDIAWSKKETDALRKAVDRGLHLHTIAYLLGRTDEAVKSKLAELKRRGVHA